MNDTDTATRVAEQSGLRSRPSTRGVERFVLTAFPLGHFAVDWPGNSLWVLAPALAIAMDLSPAEVGILIAVHNGGGCLAYLPAGLLADSVRRRGILLACTFWWVVIGYLCASFSPSYWVLVALLCVAGLGSAAWHPIATGVMVEQMPGRRAKVLGIHAIGGTVASVGAPLCAGFLLAVLDWQSVMQLSILPTALMGLVFLRRARSIPAPRAPRLNLADLRSLALVWLEARGLRTLAMLSLYNMALVATLSMLPLYVQNVHGYSASQTGMLFAALWLVAAAAQPALGALSDNVGRKRVAASGMLIAALLIATMGSFSEPLWLSIVAVLGVGTLGGIRAVMLATMIDVAGRREATTLGLAFSMMDGVGALGAVLAGVLGTYDLRYAFALTTALLAVAIGVMVFHRFGSTSSDGP